MAKSDSIRTLSTAELLAEVRALDARMTGTSTDTTIRPATSSTSSQPDAAPALSARFDNDNGNDYGNGFIGSSIAASVVMATLVEVVAIVAVVEVMEAATAGRNPLTIIPTGIVDIVKELAMISTSAGSTPWSKRRERRTIVVVLANRMGTTRPLAGISTELRAPLT